MAIDFPASPTNGQTYLQYIYDSSIPGWRNQNSSEGIGLQFKSGLTPVIPTSVTVGSGTGTVSSDGLITFSNASYFTMNGAFTSAYKNYRVLIYRLTANSAAQVDGRFSSNGSALTGNVYYTAASYQRADGVSGAYGGFNGIGYTELCPATNEVGWSTVIWDIFQPAVSDAQTASYFQGSGYSTAIQNRQGHVMYNQAAVIDGINLYANISTNISGLVRVYGYN